MRIYNATYQNVIIDWANATLPIRAGSPISADGKVSNDSDAIGLCPRYIWQEPLEDKNVPILIGGDVVLPEVEAEYGTALTEDAIASMGGINFYNDDGSIDKESGGGGGDNGFFEVHLDEDIYTLDKTWKEIDDAMRAGKQPFIIYTSDEDGFTNVTRYVCSYSICDPYDETQYKTMFYCISILPDESRSIEVMLFIANSEDDYPFIED